MPDKERAQYQSNGRLGEVAVIAIKVQPHYLSIINYLVCFREMITMKVTVLP